MALKDLLRTADLTPADLTVLLDLSEELTREPHEHAGLLRNETVGCYFAKPSTRTRLSFGTAITRLGATPQILGPNDLQLGRGETIEDTAMVMSRFLKAFVIRTFADDDVARFARAASIPVVNALTDGHHPCQSLADLLTIRQHFGTLRGLTHLYVGDGGNTAHSLAEAGALSGMHVVLACPVGYQPDPRIVAEAAAVAEANGGSVTVTDNARNAAREANIVSTDVWLSMGQDESTKVARYESLRPFQVNDELMAAAAPDAVFMHCLPAHRGDEVTASVMDGARSLVWDQAGNRLCTQQAVLVALVDGLLTGR